MNEEYEEWIEKGQTTTKPGFSIPLAKEDLQEGQKTTRPPAAPAPKPSSPAPVKEGNKK